MKTDPVSYRQGWLDCYEKIAFGGLEEVERAVKAMARAQLKIQGARELLSTFQRETLTQ